MGRHFYVLLRSFECSCVFLYLKEHLGVCVFLFVSVCAITVCEAARFSFFLCVYPRVCVVVYLSVNVHVCMWACGRICIWICTWYHLYVCMWPCMFFLVLCVCACVCVRNRMRNGYVPFFMCVPLFVYAHVNLCTSGYSFVRCGRTCMCVIVYTFFPA